MARSGSETITGTLDFIRIAVAPGASHGNGLGGNEFAEGDTLAVDGDVGVFRVGNFQKVHSYASQVDGLCGGRTFVSGRHAQQMVVIHHEEKDGTDQNAEKEAHVIILAWAKGQFK